MNETPFPFTVWAMSALGRSSTSLRAANVSRSAAWSWPSHVRTSQPNASSFASRSPSATISSVGLSDCSSLRSTTTHNVPSRSCAAACSASQFCPSWSSPSPVITTTRPPKPRLHFAQAMPRPFEMPMPERSRVRLDPWSGDVGVSVEPAEPAEAEELILGNDAEAVQRRVQARDVVALRREEDVALGVVEAELVDVQLLVEEVHEDVEGAEARAEMARAGALDGDERVEPAHVRDQGQSGIGIRLRGGANAVELGLGDEREVGHVRHVIRSRRLVSRGRPWSQGG